MPEKYLDKARQLRANHFEKVSRIEQKFAEKRGHIPGNPSKRKTLSLPEPAIRSHLEHGDYIGTCR